MDSVQRAEIDVSEKDASLNNNNVNSFTKFSGIKEQEINSNELNRCPCCMKDYSRTFNLRRHMNRVHGMNYVDLDNYKGLIKCGFNSECPASFSRVVFYRQHLVIVHKVKLEKVTINFDSINEFLEWKIVEERASHSRFNKFKREVNLKHTNDVKKRSYLCCRSGSTFEKGIQKKRSMKIGTYCPAKMDVLYNDDKVVLTYFKTHVGHGNMEEVYKSTAKKRTQEAIKRHKKLYDTLKEEIQHKIARFLEDLNFNKYSIDLLKQISNEFDIVFNLRDDINTHENEIDWSTCLNTSSEIIDSFEANWKLKYSSLEKRGVLNTASSMENVQNENCMDLSYSPENPVIYVTSALQSNEINSLGSTSSLTSNCVTVFSSKTNQQASVVPSQKSENQLVYIMSGNTILPVPVVSSETSSIISNHDTSIKIPDSTSCNIAQELHLMTNDNLASFTDTNTFNSANDQGGYQICTMNDSETVVANHMESSKFINENEVSDMGSTITEVVATCNGFIIPTSPILDLSSTQTSTVASIDNSTTNSMDPKDLPNKALYESQILLLPSQPQSIANTDPIFIDCSLKTSQLCKHHVLPENNSKLPSTDNTQQSNSISIPDSAEFDVIMEGLASGSSQVTQDKNMLLSSLSSNIPNQTLNEQTKMLLASQNSKDLSLLSSEISKQSITESAEIFLSSITDDYLKSVSVNDNHLMHLTPRAESEKDVLFSEKEMLSMSIIPASSEVKNVLNSDKNDIITEDKAYSSKVVRMSFEDIPTNDMLLSQADVTLKNLTSHKKLHIENNTSEERINMSAENSLLLPEIHSLSKESTVDQTNISVTEDLLEIISVNDGEMLLSTTDSSLVELSASNVSSDTVFSSNCQLLSSTSEVTSCNDSKMLNSAPANNNKQLSSFACLSELITASDNHKTVSVISNENQVLLSTPPISLTETSFSENNELSSENNLATFDKCSFSSKVSLVDKAQQFEHTSHSNLIHLPDKGIQQLSSVVNNPVTENLLSMSENSMSTSNSLLIAASNECLNNFLPNNEADELFSAFEKSTASAAIVSINESHAAGGILLGNDTNNHPLSEKLPSLKTSSFSSDVRLAIPKSSSICATLIESKLLSPSHKSESRPIVVYASKVNQLDTDSNTAVSEKPITIQTNDSNSLKIVMLQKQKNVVPEIPSMEKKKSPKRPIKRRPPNTPVSNNKKKNKPTVPKMKIQAKPNRFNTANNSSKLLNEDKNEKSLISLLKNQNSVSTIDISPPIAQVISVKHNVSSSLNTSESTLLNKHFNRQNDEDLISLSTQKKNLLDSLWNSYKNGPPPNRKKVV